MKDFIMSFSGQEIALIISVLVLSIVAVLSMLKAPTLTKISNALDAADKVVDTVQVLAPKIPYIDIVCKITEFAKTAAEAAEQKAKIGAIPKEERKEYAVGQVFAMLNAANVDPSLADSGLVDMAIEAAVTNLPSKGGNAVEALPCDGEPDE